MERFDTPNDVIDALGGTTSVARLFECDPRVVSNWRGQERFPARTFLVFRDALAAIGKSAPEHLWAMTKPKPPSESAPAKPAPGRAA